MEVDTVVLDIDGVLIDTSASYHQAIVDSVETVYGETVALSETQKFKDAGGFNNDWRVTEAIALYILYRREGYAKSIDRLTEEIEQHGGGIDAARETLAKDFAAEAVRRVESKWDPDELKRTFQWLYLGPTRYEQFESSPPPETIPPEAGYIENEPVLITDETIQWLESTYTLGVVTGRPRAEAEIAIGRVGLNIPDTRMMTMDDWDSGKPDPAALMQVSEHCKASNVAYAGDELDDVRMARKAETADPARQYYGIGVQSGGVTGEEGRKRFQAVGASAVIDTINQLPSIIE